jgi:hypothetical protein
MLALLLRGRRRERTKFIALTGLRGGIWEQSTRLDSIIKVE